MYWFPEPCLLCPKSTIHVFKICLRCDSICRIELRLTSNRKLLHHLVQHCHYILNKDSTISYYISFVTMIALSRLGLSILLFGEIFLLNVPINPFLLQSILILYYCFVLFTFLSIADKQRNWSIQGNRFN